MQKSALMQTMLDQLQQQVKDDEIDIERKIKDFEKEWRENRPASGQCNMS